MTIKEQPLFSPSTPTLESQPLLDHGPINYLAYGSNLCKTSFLTRRGIHPLASTPVLAPSLALAFTLAGVPYLEPRFANVRPALPNDSPLIGVVYSVTSADFATILATEGGGAAYQVVPVDCVEINGAGLVAAFTLMAREGRDEWGRPSERYLKLLRDGAEEHKLPGEYQEWLAGLRAYERVGLGQRVGAVVMVVVWMPAVVAMILAMKMCAGEDGRVPRWLVKFQRGIEAGMWGFYEKGLRVMCGEAE